jgi:hypothetical protein
MGMKESIPNRQYTDEFKVEAVRLSESIGGGQATHIGQPEIPGRTRQEAAVTYVRLLTTNSGVGNRGPLSWSN